MKKGFVLAGLVALFSGCGSSDDSATVVPSVFTGNQTTYALQAASAYPISGTVAFREKKDGTASIEIALKGITDNDQHPVHLHLGDLSTDKAAIAALLNPVAGKDGKSVTSISELADETKVTYASLIGLAACVKIHLGSVGDEANVILAAGNIGSAASNSTSGARLGVAVCASK